MRDFETTADFLAGKYSGFGKKPIKRFQGNFWGINRNRCTMIPAETIELMVVAGLATRSGESIIYMVPVAQRRA